MAWSWIVYRPISLQGQGDSWKKRLDEELEACEVFVALITKEYPNNRYCKYELDEAFKQYKEEEKSSEKDGNKETKNLKEKKNIKKIFPFVLEEKIPTALQQMLGDDIQFDVDFHTLSPEKRINFIIDAVDEYLKK